MTTEVVAAPVSFRSVRRSVAGWLTLRPCPASPGMRMASWLLAGQVAIAAGQFGFSMIRARSLSLDAYGQWAFAAALVSIFGVFADFGLTIVLVRELSSTRERSVHLLRAATAASLLLALAVSVAVALALIVIQPGRAATVVAGMYCAQLVVAAFGTAPLAYNRARHDTAWESAGRVAQAALLVAGGVAMMRLGAGIGAFAALALASVAAGGTPVIVRAARTAGWIAPQFDISATRRLLRSAAPIGLAMAATSIYYYFDTVLMGILGQRDGVARYSAAYTLLFAATLGIGVLQGAFMPQLSRAAGEGLAVLRDTVRPFFAASAAGALLLLAIGPASARLLLTHLYGAPFADASTALRLLFVTGAVMFASSASGTVMLAMNRQRPYLNVVLAGAAINVVLNLLLIPRFSLDGAAVATLTAEAAVSVLMALQVRRAWRELGAMHARCDAHDPREAA